MAEGNGNKKAYTEVVEKKNNQDIPLSIYSIERGKKEINNIKIEDILENNDFFNDLMTKSRSPYLSLITTKNIKTLISYCLNPKMYANNNNIINRLRYPYYSSQILCSQIVLLFSKSTKNIKRANDFAANKDNINNNENKNNKSIFKSKSSDYIKNSGDYFDNYLDFDQNEDLYIDENRERNIQDFYQFKRDFGNEERYAEISETEFYKEPSIKKPITEYDYDEKKIIKEILDEIFSLADYNNKEDQTYIGYFQKLINYILFYESNIILDYLYKNRETSLIKFYKNLDSASIQYILENILNILLDNEVTTEKEENKYKIIINDLIKELNNENNLGKVEFICDLIINTLINNSEKQLIDIVFKQNNFINQIKEIISKIINKENDENNNRAIIGIIQLLCQLNNIIINTFNESPYFKKNIKNFDLSIDIYKKVNTFEYRYISHKTIRNKNIFIEYENHIYLYLKEIYEIFDLIKIEIKNKNKKYNENIKNNSNNNNFGLRNLYEWKLILNTLKIYIYSFYAVEKFNDKNNLKYFAGYSDKELRNFVDEELIKIMFKYHFAYPNNNIYQNIFTEIITLICNEKCPESIITPFLKDKNNIRNKYICKIIKNIKEEFYRKNNKYRLLLGTNIEILKIFFSSNNSYILQNLDKFQIDKNIKDIFKDSIMPKIERQLLDNYEYSDSEIFNDENDNNTTFDGNDKMQQYGSFKKLIEKFIKKKFKVDNEKFENSGIKDKKEINDKNNKKQKVKYKIKDYEIENNLNSIIEKRIYTKKNNDTNILMEIEMELEEKILDEDIESISSDLDE